MSKGIRRSLGIVVVSMLMAALPAGTALAASQIYCPDFNPCYGTWEDDAIYGDIRYNRIWANSGNDYVDGWYENDEISPGPGNDIVLGYFGDDLISGELPNGGCWQTDDAGNDQLYGEDGNDTISDGVGQDDAYGGPGNDEINVEDGSGDDYVDAGPGYDTVYADPGDTVIYTEAILQDGPVRVDCPPAVYLRGAKSYAKQETADQQSPAPPKLSKADPESAADEKSLSTRERSTPPQERSAVK
jgi:hypothetical protein